MATMIRVPKTEYQRLSSIAKRYEMLRRAFTANFFEQPSTKSRKEVLKALSASGKYNQAFLQSVQAGLKDSSYFR